MRARARRRGTRADDGAATHYELAQPPTDAISAIAFAPQSPTRLLVASWDRNVYQYDLAGGENAAKRVASFEHRAPVLDVCFGAGDDEAFSGGADWQVKRLDLESGEQTVVGAHTAPVKSVVYSREHCTFAGRAWPR